ncbi:hypothetical protein PVK06_001531 [Gossypium arboreum]|uniref:Reverse transcriptase zinc-binding domain-containing protein n=1 Tax=Gossypium arboreum TaxID=29729 RepID=A0ABR0R294_GOSAR|nr:hypothetical protein PVK06_001531 [Gossypium arboreum]
MEEFRSALEDYGLNDLGYTGRWFKWERGRIFSTNIRERLDRGVVSIDWLNLFSNCKVEHLSHAFSDHYPILLDTIGKQRFDHAEGLKLFRFEASWCLENSFEKILKRKWESLIGSVPTNIKESIVNLLGVREASNPKKYLGLPMMVNRKKNWAFADFVDRYSFCKIWLLPIVYLEKHLWGQRFDSEGTIWRIGNGTRVNLWHDPWILGQNNNRLVFQNFIPQLNSVNQLIEPITNTWNEELIGSIADSDQFQRILAIPINIHGLEDMPVRKHKATGEFFVRSGYRVLITKNNQNNIYNLPNTHFSTDFYKMLWNLQIPSKVKIHVWRLSKNLVPHLCNLAQKTLVAEVFCPFCKKESEDSDHLLWSCCILRQFWRGL